MHCLRVFGIAALVLTFSVAPGLSQRTSVPGSIQPDPQAEMDQEMQRKMQKQRQKKRFVN